MAITSYKLTNPVTSVTENFNEILLLRIIKIAKVRDKGLYDILVAKYENLEKKVFNEDLLK